MELNPYYETELGKLYHGDCLEIMPGLEPVDCFVTDPPYGIEGGRGGQAKERRKADYTTDCDTEDYVRNLCVPIVEKLVRCTKRGALTPGNKLFMYYPRPVDVGCFHFPAACGRGSWGFITASFIFYYGKDRKAGLGSTPNGITVVERPPNLNHPCPKPYNMWSWLVQKVVGKDESVIDPFLGSGTTAVVCERYNRRWIGIEIEEKYCEIAAKRIENERKQLKLF